MNRFLFLLMTAAFGAMGLALQVVFIRQLMVAFLGNEIVIALVLAGWLGGVAAGARFLGLFGGVLPGRGWLWVLPPLWIAVAGVLLWTSFILPSLAGLSTGETAPLGVVFKWSLLLTAPVGFFVGALFVAAGAAWDRESDAGGPERSAVGGAIFYAEAAGSCLGLLFYVYWLAGRFGPVTVYLIFAGLLLLLWLTALPRLNSTRLTAAVVLTLAAVLVWSFDAGGRLDRAADRARFEGAHPGYEYLAGRDTPYQHLSVGGRSGEKAMFGNGVFVTSWPDPYSYEIPALFFLSEARSFDRVLLIGDGPGAFIHELLERDVKSLVYVTLDPAETDLAADYLPPEMLRDLADPRLTVIHDDPRRALEDRAAGPFDLAVVSAPDPDNARLNRLYTVEFFRAVRARLSSSGVLVASITGAANYWNADLLSYGGSLYRTMRRVFPEVLVTPGDVHYLVAGVRPGLATDDPEELAARYRDRGFSSPHMTPRSLTAFFPPGGRDYLEASLRKAAGAGPINTDRRPLTYILRLIWWEDMTGSAWTGNLLRGVLQADNWAPWAAALLLLPLLAAVLKIKPRRTASLTMFTTGAAVMALQVLLIFMFQNHRGVVYRDIALLTALFMAGSAGGGLLGRLAAGLAAAPALLLPVLEAILAGLAALAFWAVHTGAADLILPLVGLSGLAGGMEFALLYAFFLNDPSRPTAAAGLSRLESADHVGAAAGALAGGLVLAPVVGLGLSAGALAAFKAAGALAMLRLARG